MLCMLFQTKNCKRKRCLPEELGSMSVFDKLWIGCKLLIRHPMLYTKGSSAYYYPLDTVKLNILVGEIMYSLLIPLAIIASVFWIFRPKFVRWVSLIIALPFFGLAFAFMLNDTSLLHVASNGGENLPLKYRFAATWSARERPLLLWAAWMALLAHFYAKPLIGESKF